MKELNPSVKHHLIVGILIGLWLFIFAFVIRPFDDGTLNFRSWLLISGGFSIMAFLCYALLAVLQKRLYKEVLNWNLGFEVGSILFFHAIYLLGTYLYYISPLLNGGYSFGIFFSIIFIKVALILTPVLLLARRYLIKFIPVKEDRLTIRGQNKLDVLKIKKADLVCISNAQNYVEIFYTQNGTLGSKLIRTSLKKVQEDLGFLVQVHRSHLINPLHFKSWRNQNTIMLTQIELPVSKSYKESVLAL